MSRVASKQVSASRCIEDGVSSVRDASDTSRAGLDLRPSRPAAAAWSGFIPWTSRRSDHVLLGSGCRVRSPCRLGPATASWLGPLIFAAEAVLDRVGSFVPIELKHAGRAESRAGSGPVGSGRVASGRMRSSALTFIEVVRAARRVSALQSVTGERVMHCHKTPPTPPESQFQSECS